MQAKDLKRERGKEKIGFDTHCLQHDVRAKGARLYENVRVPLHPDFSSSSYTYRIQGTTSVVNADHLRDEQGKSDTYGGKECRLVLLCG